MNDRTDANTSAIAQNRDYENIEFSDPKIICIRDAFKRLQVNGNKIWFDDYIHDKLIHRVYVHLFNWDIVKVDKSYILDHKKRKLIYNIIIDIGNVVDKIIIEGVETPYQYHLLKLKKVNMQGFHISKPISKYKATKFLDVNKKFLFTSN
ncbi:EAL domain-containing protein [Vibrio atlanticus]|nr:EAL domain-containing protein [Vibrio atlanticus]